MERSLASAPVTERARGPDDYDGDGCDMFAFSEELFYSSVLAP
jgi:hypothetical protein